MTLEVKEITVTIEKRPLSLVLPYLSSISLQIRTKLKMSLKNILNCCKLQIVFKNKTKLGTTFISKTRLPKILLMLLFIYFSVESAMCRIMVKCARHLNVSIGEHIGLSPLTKKQVKLKYNSVADHLLFCKHSASYDNFRILTCENKKFLLKLKESLLILRDKPSSNRKITSEPLHLFDRP